jgi:5'-3' exonuclease
VAEDEEADDLLGIGQNNARDDTIICTVDKDLNMIPGWKYDFVKDEKFYVSEDEALHNFYRQLIVGDSTDNIVGIPRAGVARANKLLSDRTLEEQWENVVAEYMAKGGENWEEYLTEQGRLLWIRREVGEMWEPDLSGFGTEITETEVNLYD